MDKTLDFFEQWCKTNNWIIKRNEVKVSLPEKITQRYPLVSESDYLKFVNAFEMCYTDDEQSWFLCEHEYKKDANETELGWDIMELMSIEASEEDEEECKKIRKWWNNYIPILLSVRDGYSHFSMSLQKSSFGQIVEGYEPMFEDTVIVANSLKEFLEKIMNKEIVFN